MLCGYPEAQGSLLRSNLPEFVAGSGALSVGGHLNVLVMFRFAFFFFFVWSASSLAAFGIWWQMIGITGMLVQELVSPQTIFP